MCERPHSIGIALRNTFDQYSQPENRVTHALMTALDVKMRQTLTPPKVTMSGLILLSFF
jgi:hypothetical protein